MTVRRLKRQLRRIDRQAGAAEKQLRRIDARAETMRDDAARGLPEWMRNDAPGLPEWMRDDGPRALPDWMT